MGSGLLLSHRVRRGREDPWAASELRTLIWHKPTRRSARKRWQKLNGTRLALGSGMPESRITSLSLMAVLSAAPLALAGCSHEGHGEPTADPESGWTIEILGEDYTPGGEGGELGASDADAPGEGAAADRTSGGEPPDTSPGPQPAPGLLTAGVWDDNLNYGGFADFYDSSVPECLDISLAEHDQANAAFRDRAAKSKLDIALVLDLTGSMGDEIDYLKVELDAIAEDIKSAYGNAEQRWALAVYRDSSDEFLVRGRDFTSVSEIQALLKTEQADGGGDYPEASHAGLGVANAFAWRTDEDTARVVFWVADAPHHAEHNGEMTQAIRDARKHDIHIYPVASSGVDEPTELSMRQAAQFTGGRYVFLTDDSGVGGAHNEATAPCFYVTSLADAMKRMVASEMQGEPVQPDAESVIRTVGDPVDGICEAVDGVQAI